MAERTGIAWTRSTWNPWIGCTEVSPGCDHCYARVLDARHRWGGAAHWGAGVPRYVRPEQAWKEPKLWNKKARLELAAGSFVTGHKWPGRPGFWPVFPSMCDPFDNEVSEDLHRRFWALISLTPHLTWLLLTKRIGNARRMIEAYADRSVFPAPNVWIGASIVNQLEADRDLPKLCNTPAHRRFVSYEPALEPVHWLEHLESRQIHQLIIGGESHQGKHKARPFSVEAARTAVRQCRRVGVAPFVKQMGDDPIWNGFSSPGDNVHDWPSARREDRGEGYFHIQLKTRGGGDPAEWPEDLRVQEWPA